MVANLALRTSPFTFYHFKEVFHMSERILEFVVDKQRIKRKKGCDFSGIVAGSVGYLRAKFEFSKEWNGCVKIASFENQNGDPYPIRIDEDNTCLIPSDALKDARFQVQCFGGGPGFRIETDKLKVRQEVH